MSDPDGPSGLDNREPQRDVFGFSNTNAESSEDGSDDERVHARGESPTETAAGASGGRDPNLNNERGGGSVPKVETNLVAEATKTEPDSSGTVLGADSPLVAIWEQFFESQDAEFPDMSDEDIKAWYSDLCVTHGKLERVINGSTMLLVHHPPGILPNFADSPSDKSAQAGGEAGNDDASSETTADGAEFGEYGNHNEIIETIVGADTKLLIAIFDEIALPPPLEGESEEVSWDWFANDEEFAEMNVSAKRAFLVHVVKTIREREQQLQVEHEAKILRRNFEEKATREKEENAILAADLARLQARAVDLERAVETAQQQAAEAESLVQQQQATPVQSAPSPSQNFLPHFVPVSQSYFRSRVSDRVHTSSPGEANYGAAVDDDGSPCRPRTSSIANSRRPGRGTDNPHPGHAAIDELSVTRPMPSPTRPASMAMYETLHGTSPEPFDEHRSSVGASPFEANIATREVTFRPQAGESVHSTGVPDERIAAEKYAQQEELRDAKKLPSFKKNAIPSHNQGKFNAVNATPQTWDRWQVGAQTALQIVGVLIVLTCSDVSAPEITFDMMCHGTSCILSMLDASSQMMFKAWVGRSDARGLWAAIKKSIHSETKWSIAQKKKAMYELEFKDKGNLLQTVKAFWNDVAERRDEIRSYDPTFAIDMGMFRLQLLSTLPDQFQTSDEDLEKLESFRDMQTWMVNKATTADVRAMVKGKQRKKVAVANPAYERPPASSSDVKIPHGLKNRAGNRCEHPNHSEFSHTNEKCVLWKKLNVTFDKGTAQSNAAGGDISNMKCFRCLEKGHRADKCSKPMKCLLCKEPGHLKRDCPKRTASSNAAVASAEGRAMPAAMPDLIDSASDGTAATAEVVTGDDGSADEITATVVTNDGQANAVKANGRVFVRGKAAVKNFSWSSILAVAVVFSGIPENTAVEFPERRLPDMNTTATSTPEPSLIDVPATGWTNNPAVACMGVTPLQRNLYGMPSTTTPVYVSTHDNDVSWCMLSNNEMATWYKDEGVCVDSGCNLPIFTADYKAKNEDKFEKPSADDIMHLPRTMGNWQGSRQSIDADSFFWYNHTIETDKGPRSTRIGPGYVSNTSVMNLLGEEQFVKQWNARLIHDPKEGKFMEFQDGARCFLNHVNGLQFLPPDIDAACSHAQANAGPAAGKPVPQGSISTDDAERAWEVQRLLVADQATAHTSTGNTLPSPEFEQEVHDSYVEDLAEATTQSYTAWISKQFIWLRSVACGRSPQQVEKLAKKMKVKLTDRDQKYINVGYTRSKPDRPRVKNTYEVGDQIRIDPCSLPQPSYNKNTTVFFTQDAKSRRVRVHATANKSSESAVEAIQEYCRQSPAYRNLTRKYPKIIKSDSEVIFTSAWFLSVLRGWWTGSQLSSPYKHYMNSGIEKVIGTIWGGANSCIHNATAFDHKLKTDCGRNVQEFFEYALGWGTDIDSYLEPSGRDDLCPYTLDEGTSPPYHMMQDFWGSEVMVKVGKGARKTEVKCKEGFMIGISPYHVDAYQVYMPSTDRINVCSHTDVFFATNTPRADYLPVLDDDGFEEDDTFIIDLGKHPPLGDAPPTTSSGNETVTVQTDRLDGDAPEMVHDTKSAGAVLPVKKKVKGKRNRVSTGKDKHPFKVGMEVLVDYGNGQYYAGNITKLSKKTMIVEFIASNEFAELAAKQFHLVKQNDTKDVAAVISVVLADGDVYHLQSSEVNATKTPMEAIPQLAVHLAFLEEESIVNAAAAQDEMTAEDVDGDVFKVDPKPLPVPTPSAKQLSHANIALGFIAAMARTLEPTTLPWETEPDLQYASTEWIIQDLPPDLKIHVEAHMAISNFHGPEELVYKTSNEHWDEHETGEMIANPAMVTFTMRDVNRMQDGPERAGYIAARDKEIDGLVEAECWSEEPPPPGAIILDTKFFMHTKLDGTQKGRLCVKGYAQPLHSYNDTEAPVLLEHSFNCLMSIFATLELDYEHWDWKQAFLHCTLKPEEQLWIRIAKDLDHPLAGQVRKLIRNLYGLKQASKNYYVLMMELFVEFGFTQSKFDPCIYFYMSDRPAFLLDEQGGVIKDKDYKGAAKCLHVVDKDTGETIGFQRLRPDGTPLCHCIYLGDYVDDVAIGATPGNTDMDRLEQFMIDRDQKLKRMKLELFCNMIVKKDKTTGDITVNQSKHSERLCKEVLQREGQVIEDLDKVKAPATPFPPGYHFEIRTKADDVDDFMTDERVTEFRSWCMGFQWVAKTLVGIKYPICQLCRCMANPTKKNYNDLVRLARWVAKNRRRSLVFHREGDLIVSASSDSDWAACKTTRRSCTGYAVSIGKSLVIAKAQMQKSVAMSSMEAELIAMTEAAKTVVYFRGLMNELGFPQVEPARIDVDNQSCIQMSRSTMSCYRNRHIPIRYYYCKQLIKDGEIDPQWIPSAENMSDLFTKCVSGELFDKHQDSMSREVVD